MSLRVTPRGRRAGRLVLAMLGVGFGVLVSAVNHGYGPAPEYVSTVIGSGWFWLATGLGACSLGRGWKQSWLNGMTFLCPAIIGYYSADTAAGVYTSAALTDPTGPTHLDLLGLVGDTVGYLVVAAAASAVLAVVVLLSRRRGVVGLLGAVAVPGYIAYDALRLYHDLERLPPRFDDPPTSAAILAMGLMALTVCVLIAAVQLPGLGPARTRPPPSPAAGRSTQAECVQRR